MLYALFAADALMMIVFGLRFSSLPPEIPLFYSRSWGENQLADTWMIVFLPICLHLFIFLNQLIYTRYFIPNQFIKKITDITNLTIIATCTLIFLKIILFIT